MLPLVFFFTFLKLNPVFVFSAVSDSAFKLDYEKLYKSGVDAYLQNRWKDCVTLIEKALEDYDYYQSSLLKCRKDCKDFKTSSFPRDHDSFLNLWNLQSAATERALCLIQCQKSYFLNRSKPSQETDDFIGKVPYNYLQLCYFKLDEPEKAASCAYTFLIHNPDHEVMKTNLKYYMALPGIKVDKIIYLEPKNYQDLFLKGAQLYMESNFSSSIEVMETSLLEYFKAEEECRNLCEGPMPNASKEELFLSVANHFTYDLRCKLKCPGKLSYMYAQKHGHLLSSHYHYLQFNYFKVGNLEKACRAVASFLLFQPKDEVMNDNREFYAKQPNVQADWFTPRQEAEEYFKRFQRETDMLLAIEKHFYFNEAEELLPPPGVIAPIQKRNLGSPRKKLSSGGISNWLQQEGLEIIMKNQQLNGTDRVLLSNLATEKECQMLVDLVEQGGVHGDGYNGKESPHTAFEKFEGLTVTRAAVLAQRGLLDPSATELFLNVSEKARRTVEAYFNLESELFFSYTHLVCRTALPDAPVDRADFSHPIHADNCILRPNGKCAKEKPAYTWRDYSSIVYLNDDFEGGEFVFAENKQTVQNI